MLLLSQSSGNVVNYNATQEIFYAIRVIYSSHESIDYVSSDSRKTVLFTSTPMQYTVTKDGWVWGNNFKINGLNTSSPATVKKGDIISHVIDYEEKRSLSSYPGDGQRYQTIYRPTATTRSNVYFAPYK